MFKNPVIIIINEDSSIENLAGYNWKFEEESISLNDGKDITQLIISNAWDWERKKLTIVFSGINPLCSGLYG